MESIATSLGLTANADSADRVAACLEKLMIRYDGQLSALQLTEDLASRLALGDLEERRSLVLFCESRHDEPSPPIRSERSSQGLVSKWRQKDRLKTTAVALVMCLNIGVDPPDIIKVSPCARTECWVDPLSMPAAKALDTIGKQLQSQYERWQPRAKYRMHLDPTTDDVRKLTTSSRRMARTERVLFHYNGHGVPRPTANGEIWVFNKSYTQYIPLSLYDLEVWVGSPAIYVFDCSSAGQVLISFKQFMLQRAQEMERFMSQGAYAQGQAQGASAGTFHPNGSGGNGLPGGSASQAGAGGSAAGCGGAGSASNGSHGGQQNPRAPDPMKNTILLCACGTNDVLPQSPDLPADLFTACLTTPIKIALQWSTLRSRLRLPRLDRDLVDRIPGKPTDRKAPVGELNWIFTAITDTIAWNVLPRALFQRLFRQDLLVASLFRNYLLADRIMRAHGCTPACHPRLPPTHQHPMWSAWDLAAEACLLQMPDLIDGVPGADYVPSPFFSQQLTAFELWLSHGAPDKRPPEQLPIVLQVLLSQVHRLRALVLLGRFLDMGVWAVDLALSVGIFPYVLKLLQTSAPDLRQTLVFIWTKILAWDASPAVQGDLVKDGGHAYFVKHLDARDAPVAPESRAQAAFVLAAICDAHPRGQVLCAQSGLLSVCLAHLPAALGVLASAFERRAAASLAARRREMGASVRRATPFARGREGDGEGEEGLGGGGAPRARSLGALAETTCAPDLFGGGLDPAALPPARALALLARWLLLLVGRLVQNSPEVTALALHEQAQSPLAEILASQDSDIRAAAVCALGALIGVPQAESDEAGGGGSQHGGAGVPAAASSDSVAASGQEAAAGVEAGQPPAPSTEADRLVQERAIACVLLEAVYDASPTVRAELAAALARFAVGHSLLFQDAVAAHRRALAAARVSSAQPARAGAPPPPSGGAAGGAGSAPSATGAGFEARAVGKDPRKDRDSSAPAREEATPAMAAPRGKAAPRAMSAGDLGGGGEGASPEGTSRARPAPQGKPPPPGGLASPGVRVRYDSSYEPLLRVGLGEVAGTPGGYDDPEEGAGKTCGYATADAARVGGGLYAAVVEALCTLATDPSPRVAATGRAALRAAGVLILPRPAAPAGGQQGGSGSVGGGAGARAAGASPMTSPRPAHRSGSARELGAAPSPGSASVAAERVASMLSKAWQPRGWRGGAAAAAAVPPPQPQGGTPAGSTPGSPNTSPCAPQLCARPLYTLRHAGEPESLGAQGLGLARVASAAAALGGGAGEGSRAASARASAASLVGLEGTAVPIVAGGATITLTGAGVGGSMSAARAASPAAARATSPAAALPPPATPPPVQPPAPVPPGPLPKSPAYLAACEYFTYPLLAPQALEVPGAAHATWLLEPDPRTRAEREWARAERLAACGSMHAPGAAFRLREQVTTVESEGERVVALGWDALRPHLVTADGEGYLRVSSTAGHQALNRFHVAAPPPGAPAAVAPPAPTLLRGVWVLNEIHSGLLATGAADGAVRIWRNFAQRGQQRLATAWQSVLLPAHGAPGTAAQYALDPVANRLFASGGQRAERVYLWDLEREACAAQLRCELGRAASVSSLAASSRSGAVFAAADDGTVHVFDVRAPAAVGAAQARRQRLTDLVLEPGGLEHQLVLGYPTGQLAFLDARVASSDGGARLEVGVWKTIEAHSKGGVSAMAAHPHAPFLATATRSQVVKLWSAGGDQVGVVRAHTSFLSHRLGPITCMGWAPYDPVLAAGGDDPIAAVYAVEPQPTGRKSGSVEHLAAQLRSASLSSLPSAGF